MASPRLNIFVENRFDPPIVEAIYTEEVSKGLVQVESGHTTSGAIGLAELSLLQHPQFPVALLLNSRTEDLSDCADLLATAKRILARASLDNWHVALAIPRLDAWAMCDPRIKSCFETDAQTREGNVAVYSNRAAKMKKLTQHHLFDREALRHASTQFAALDAFVQQHLQASAQPRRALSF